MVQFFLVITTCIETQQLGHFAFTTWRCAQIYPTLTSKQPNPQSLLLVVVVVRKLFVASFPCAVWIFSPAFCSGSFTTRVVKEYFHLDIARLLCRYSFFIAVADLMTLVALLILLSVLFPYCQLKEAASWLSVLFLVFLISRIAYAYSLWVWKLVKKILENSRITVSCQKDLFPKHYQTF